MRAPLTLALSAVLVACSGSTIDTTGTPAAGGSDEMGSGSTDPSTPGAAAGEEGFVDSDTNAGGSGSVAGGTTGSTGSGTSGSDAVGAGAGSPSSASGVTVDGATAGATAGSAGADTDPSSATSAASPSYLSARVRRMTAEEFRATVSDVFGVEISVEDFVPDTRQSGFTRNAAQIVDPLFARQLQTAADTIAAEFVGRLSNDTPCASAAADAACARSVLDELLPRALRRPVESAEVDALVDGVFTPAANADGFTVGMRLAISALLQSASFIYHTELGATDSSAAPTTLTASETAAALSYLVTGAPPDAALQQAATSGALATADGRAAETRRLLAQPGARPQVTTLIKEWLGIDALVDIGKDNEKFDQYEELRPYMLDETDAFVEQVVFVEGGSLATLLSADYTMIGPEMAGFYGVTPGGAGGPQQVSLAGAGRRGLLNHASFLARYATEVDSAPVRRGVAVGRRVLCVDPGDPTALNVTIVPPQPDPNQTTRERFTQHTIDPECAGCHMGIDGVGFTFENFDAIGALRVEENGTNVDTKTSLPSSWAAGLPADQFEDSTDLALALGQSESVKRCFARHLGRFAGATTNAASEEYFLSTWAALETAGRDSLTKSW